MSDPANKLIAENKKTKAKFLDLSNCSMTELPAELADLIWLETLILPSSWGDPAESGAKTYDVKKNKSRTDGLNIVSLVKQLPLFGILFGGSVLVPAVAKIIESVSEQSFDPNVIKVVDLANLSGLRGLRSLYLSGKNISDLAPLSGLLALQTLHLNGTEVSDLTPLSCLIALQTLELSGSQVSDLAPLTGLYALQSLHLNETKVNDLAPLSCLTTLQTLELSGTRVVDIAPLTGLKALQSLHLNETKVNDLAPLSGLTTLQALELSGTQVVVLAPLTGLKALQLLHLNGTKVNDLGPLSGLTTLQTLDFSGTQVVDLAPLSSLTALQILKFSDTQVSDLTPLVSLNALQYINLCGTQVFDIMPLVHLIELDRKVSIELGSGDILVHNCPLSKPPVEIVAQGNKAILNYSRERVAGGVDHLYEAKMIILGETGSGKTSLVRRLFQQDLPLPDEGDFSKGIAIHRHDFPLPNGRNFRLNVWDFGAHTIFHATHQFFLTRRSLYVLLDDTRRSDNSASDPGFKEWLDLIELFGGDSPVLIFQNEKGGREKNIDFDGIRARYPHVMKSFSGNLEYPMAAISIGEAIKSFASRLPHIGEELPSAWIKVRADIETAATSQPYISLQQYLEIYERHLPANRIKALHLSHYLHDLGVFLHFQDDKLLAKTIILQNQWVTQAVYRLLDDEFIKKQNGRFTDVDFTRLWGDSQYADMHPELLALMRHFELCYLLPSSQPATWLAPQLLDAAGPKALINWNRAGDLVLCYRYAIMPRGIISRLLVRLHRFLRDPENASINCVLFQQTETAVLATRSDDGREIELRARGPERKALLSVVAADLEAINDGFQGLRNKVDKLIPCDCSQCIASTTPYLYEEKRLRKRVEDQVLTIECPISYKMVSVLAIIDGIKGVQLPVGSEEAIPAQRLRTVNSFDGLDKYVFDIVQSEPIDETQFLANHRFWFKKLHIKNFRCFKALEVDLNERLTVFVAKNGGGKSAVLDAIAIALGGFVEGFYIGIARKIGDKDVRLLKTGQNQEVNRMEQQFPTGIRAVAQIGVRAVNWVNELSSTDANKNWTESKDFTELAAAMQNAISNNEQIVLPLIAYYGTNRLQVAVRNSVRDLDEEFGQEFFSRTAGYENCLDPATHYKDFEKWFIYAAKANAMSHLRQLEYPNTNNIEVETPFAPLLNSVKQAVDVCLGIIGWKNLHYSFTHLTLMMEHSDHGLLEVGSLSDGVRNMIALVADIAHRAVRLNPQLRSNAARLTPGIVLIDEVDLHLHPEWQRVVLQNLGVAFPFLQFVVTSHSPHIIQAAAPYQVIGLYYDKDVGYRQDFPGGKYGYQGWALDEVLLDVMNVGDTKTSQYNDAISWLERAIDDEDYDAGLRSFETVSGLLHPTNHLRKILKIQLAGIKGAKDDQVN